MEIGNDWVSVQIEKILKEIAFRATPLCQSLTPLQMSEPYKNAGVAAIQPRHSPPPGCKFAESPMVSIADFISESTPCFSTSLVPFAERRIINMLHQVKSLARSIWYCVKIAWSSSKVYTIIRLMSNILVPFISICSTYIIKRILDNLVLGGELSFQRITSLLALGLLLTILSLLIQRAAGYAQIMHSNIIQKHISLQILDKAMSFDIAMFDNSQLFDKFTAVRTDALYLSNIMWSVLECFSACFSLICSFVILSQQNIWYAICIILLIVPATFVNHYYTRKLYENDLQQTNNERKKNYIYSVGSSKEYAQEIRCWNLGEFLKQRYTHLWKIALQTRKSLSFRQASAVFLLSLLPEFAIFLISVHIVKQVLNQQLTVGDYTFYSGVMSQVLSSTMILIESMITVYNNKLRIDNISAFEQNYIQTIVSGSRSIERIESIEFVNVGFVYPGTTIQVLENVNFYIKCGETVALVGKNGSGKSTIIKLLFRLYDATEGKVLINGVDIREYKLAELRRCYGIYFQNGSNFAFTLLENIILNNEKRENTIRQVRTLLRECDAEDIMSACYGDMDTYLSRNFSAEGIELSAGQHQKVAIVRALYANSSCLVLDEPSSSLDPEAEFKIFENLKERTIGKITLLTSHRLTNVHLADWIMVLEYGHIIEQGTRQELLQKEDSRFSELYQYQAKKYTTD